MKLFYVEATGELINRHPLVVNELPEGWTYVEIRPQDFAALQTGDLEWDESLRALVPGARFYERENELTIANQLKSALTNNQDFLNDAEPNQGKLMAQVRTLTRQVNKLIRYELGLLEATD